MVLKFYQNSKNKIMMACIALLLLTSYSCKETQENIGSNDTKVTISMLGIADPAETNIPKSKAATAANNQETQVSTVPFSKNGSFRVTLTQDSPKKTNDAQRTSNGNRAETTIDRTPLVKDIKYTVLVYDETGKYVTEKTYVNGSGTNEEIYLSAGKTYTFIAYSINSASSIPTVADAQNLSTASLQNISSDLMFFSKKLKLTKGDNILNIILKHQYSQIITRIKMHTNTTGNITAISNPVIKPTHLNANLKLSDGAISYNGSNDNGTAVTFPALGSATRDITSTPTMLINPQSTGGTLNFGSLTIAGETKENMLIENLKVVPGQRYTLILNYEVCTQDVNGAEMSWNYPIWTKNNNDSGSGAIIDGNNTANGTVIKRDFIAPGADYGFVYDIYSIDNSINMTVNGIQLATQEIQFEPKINNYPQNIEFVDGDRYGVNNVNQVWTNGMNGNLATKTNPMIKIIISATGEITIQGRKTATGPLLPMRLFGGTTFNKINWKGGNNTNAISVSQVVQNATAIESYGSGKKKSNCNL